MTSISCCTCESPNGTRCICQLTQVTLEKQDSKGVHIYCKDKDPQICGSCSHGIGYHSPGQDNLLDQGNPNDV